MWFVCAYVFVYMCLYGCERSQNILAKDVLSDTLCLSFVVPPGIFLGPFVFTLYTQPLVITGSQY